MTPQETLSRELERVRAERNEALREAAATGRTLGRALANKAFSEASAERDEYFAALMAIMDAWEDMSLNNGKTLIRIADAIPQAVRDAWKKKNYGD